MPRFFIHSTSAGRHIPDLQGLELPDARTAREKAYAAAREIVADKIIEGDVVIKSDSVEVVDEKGELVESIPVKDVFRVV